MIKLSAFYERDRFFYLVVIFASVLLSAWIDINQDVINPDAICYLSGAEAIGQSGLKTAMKVCPQANWPFYPMLIYGFATITHFSYLVSAHLLNAIFTTLSVLFFVAIVRELGGTRLTLWLAAAVIMLWHQFNIVREYIIRDHGFWAFYLLSIYLLIRYFRQPNWLIGISWGLSLMLATLFRIEGAVFLLALPMVAWVMRQYSLRERAKAFFILSLPTLIVCLAIGIWLLSHPQQTIAQLGRLADLSYQLKHAFSMMAERYHGGKYVLGTYILNHDSVRDAGTYFVMMLVGMFVVSVIRTISIVYAALVIYALKRKVSQLSTATAWVMAAYIIINVLITLGFLSEHLFFSRRYLVALSLVFMLLIPFALEHLIQNRSRYRERVYLNVAVFFIVITSISGIVNFGYSKAYIHKAGNWLATNVPMKASMYSNDYQVMYYSHHFGHTIFEKLKTYRNPAMIAGGKWKQFDYVVLRANKRNDDDVLRVIQEMQMTPIQTFANKRGDSVYVFKIKESVS